MISKAIAYKNIPQKLANSCIMLLLGRTLSQEHSPPSPTDKPGLAASNASLLQVIVLLDKTLPFTEMENAPYLAVLLSSVMTFNRRPVCDFPSVAYLLTRKRGLCDNWPHP